MEEVPGVVVATTEAMAEALPAEATSAVEVEAPPNDKEEENDDEPPARTVFQGTLERHLPPNAQQATDFPRVLTDDAPRLAYRRRRGEDKRMLHWGQRKLLFSEIEFLVNHGTCCEPASSVTPSHLASRALRPNDAGLRRGSAGNPS
jgi:hypothetical protein